MINAVVTDVCSELSDHKLSVMVTQHTATDPHNTYTHARTHAHTHTHTHIPHTHAHTHAHTHTV